MAAGEIERLRFRLIIDNHTINEQIHPTIKIGVNLQNTIKLKSGTNDIVFDETIHSKGINLLQLEILEQKELSYLIGTFSIKKIIINGSDTFFSIYNCMYYPKYDVNQGNLPSSLQGVTTLGNRGVWKWSFVTPTYENEFLKLGLW